MTERSSSPVLTSSSQDPINQQWQSVAQSVAKPKMDLSKALAIMGFSSSRVLDPSAGHNPKTELSSALTKRMQEIETRRHQSGKRVGMNRNIEKSGPGAEQKQRDDARILHEAYQFLSRRYLSSGSSREEDADANAISPMAMLDQQHSSSKNAYNFDDTGEGYEDNSVSVAEQDAEI